MDMESIWSRGTHKWDGWRNSSGTSDPLRSVEKVFNDHDFSIKLSGGNSYIDQYSQVDSDFHGLYASGFNPVAIDDGEPTYHPSPTPAGKPDDGNSDGLFDGKILLSGFLTTDKIYRVIVMVIMAETVAWE